MSLNVNDRRLKAKVTLFFFYIWDIVGDVRDFQEGGGVSILDSWQPCDVFCTYPPFAQSYYLGAGLVITPCHLHVYKQGHWFTDLQFNTPFR